MFLLKHITMKIYLYLIFLVEFTMYDALKGVTTLLIGQKNRFIFFRILNRKIFYPNMQYCRILPVNKSSQVINARDKKNVIKTKFILIFVSSLGKVDCYLSARLNLEYQQAPIYPLDYFVLCNLYIS